MYTCMQLIINLAGTLDLTFCHAFGSFEANSVVVAILGTKFTGQLNYVYIITKTCTFNLLNNLQTQFSLHTVH